MTITATLTIVYLSFRAGVDPVTKVEQTKSVKECVEKARKIREKVKVGKVKVFCNGRRI